MKYLSITTSIVCFLASFMVSAAECEKESAQAALVATIQQWNIDGAPIGSSFKVTGVKLKPGSEGRQGVFTNIVSLEIYEAGRGSTFLTSREVEGQYTGTCHSFSALD